MKKRRVSYVTVAGLSLVAALIGPKIALADSAFTALPSDESAAKILSETPEGNTTASTPSVETSDCPLDGRPVLLPHGVKASKAGWYDEETSPLGDRYYTKGYGGPEEFDYYKWCPNYNFYAEPCGDHFDFVTGWQVIDGEKYFFVPSEDWARALHYPRIGYKASNALIWNHYSNDDPYDWSAEPDYNKDLDPSECTVTYLGMNDNSPESLNNGAVGTGWQYLKDFSNSGFDDGWYYFEDTGDVKSKYYGQMLRGRWIDGQLSSDGQRRYVKQNGRRAESETLTIDGDQYKFDSDGVATKVDVDLDALKKASDDAQARLNEANRSLQAALNAQKDAQNVFNNSDTNLKSAQAAYDKALGEQQAAQKAYNDAQNAQSSDSVKNAKATYEQAQRTEADKKAEYDRLVTVRQQKKSAYDAACDASDAAKAVYDAASTEVDGLNQQIAELKSNMTVDQDVIDAGIVGFMNYISGSDGFTDSQKANAAAAASMLTGASDKAQWYDDYVDQNMGRDTNPLSLEQMRNALTYLDTHNNLRKANGLPELSISLRMTAAAALNASYSSNNWGHSGCYWDNAENLAGGGGAYTGGETEDTLGWPYSGLYTQEKELFDRYVGQYGDALGSHRHDSFYIYLNYNSIYQECGHYLNIVDADMQAFGVATGSGKNTDSMVTIFDYSAFTDQADFTVSEFKKLLNDYIDAAYDAGGTQAQKEQLKQLQDKLSKAQKALGAADSSYLAALNKQADAQNAFADADNAMKSAESGYKQAQSDTASAKKAYDSAIAALGGNDIDTLKANLDSAKAKVAATNSALSEAKSKYDKAASVLQDANSDVDAKQTIQRYCSDEATKAKDAYESALSSVSVSMYRLYNPYTGEHFYTSNSTERDGLVDVGWLYEGEGWRAPRASSSPVYRLYNKYAGDHHYTMSVSERDSLVASGWSYEGIGWYSDDSKGTPLYRQYNPYATTGSHNYTTSKGENDSLVAVGWRAEGIAWYGIGV